MLNVGHNLANERSSEPLDIRSVLDFILVPQQDSPQIFELWSNFSIIDAGFLITKALYIIDLSLCRMIAHKLLAVCTAAGTTTEHCTKYAIELSLRSQSKKNKFVTSLLRLHNPRCALVKYGRIINTA